MIIFPLLRNDLLPLPIAGYTNQHEFFQREKITVNEGISGNCYSRNIGLFPENHFLEALRVG